MSRQLVHNLTALKQRRRELRQNLTATEALLWKNLQRSRLDGKTFRRQHSVGKYVLDFYCPECRLAVELDGEAHFSSIRAEYDVEHDEFIESLKIRTARFENRLVFENRESVHYLAHPSLARFYSSSLSSSSRISGVSFQTSTLHWRVTSHSRYSTAITP